MEERRPLYPVVLVILLICGCETPYRGGDGTRNRFRHPEALNPVTRSRRQLPCARPVLRRRSADRSEDSSPCACLPYRNRKSDCTASSHSADGFLMPIRILAVIGEGYSHYLERRQRRGKVVIWGRTRQCRTSWQLGLRRIETKLSVRGMCINIDCHRGQLISFLGLHDRHLVPYGQQSRTGEKENSKKLATDINGLLSESFDPVLLLAWLPFAPCPHPQGASLSTTTRHGCPRARNPWRSRQMTTTPLSARLPRTHNQKRLLPSALINPMSWNSQVLSPQPKRK